MTYSRVLLKLSGEALMGTQGYGIDPAIVNSIASDVAKVVAGGTELAIVVGGGNMAPDSKKRVHMGVTRSTKRRSHTSPRLIVGTRHAYAFARAFLQKA